MTHDPISALRAELQSTLDLDVEAGVALAPRTTLRVGGPAELLVRARGETGLSLLLQGCARHDVGCRILGLGSNILIPDAGLPGVTTVLEGEFLELRFAGTTVHAGAGLPLARVAKEAVDRGLAGLEALAGFPSTVGGAVVMNAGCYGVEIKDVLESARVLRPDGGPVDIGLAELAPGYRRTSLQESDTVVTRASFRLRPDETGEAAARLQELNRRRRGSMPSGRPNAGSVFKNPPGDFAGRLIEACGLKGTRRGGMEISPEHANVIVNSGGGTAAEALELMRLAYTGVLERFAIALEPEWILAGDLHRLWSEITGSRS